MTLRSDVVLAILGMALATYAVRAGGFAALRAFRPSRFVERMLAHLPGCVFVAFILPGAAGQGLAGLVAALIALAMMRATGRLTLSVVVAVGCLWAMRAATG